MNPSNPRPPAARIVRWIALFAIVAAGIALAVFARPEPSEDPEPPPAPRAEAVPAHRVEPMTIPLPTPAPPPTQAAAATAAEPNPEKPPFPDGFTPPPTPPPGTWTAIASNKGQALRALTPKLNECFEQGRTGQPGLRGKVDLDFYVIPAALGARAADRGVLKTDLPAAVSACMRKAVGAADFGGLDVGKHPLRVKATLEFPSAAVDRVLGRPHLAPLSKPFGMPAGFNAREKFAAPKSRQ